MNRLITAAAVTAMALAGAAPAAAQKKDPGGLELELPALETWTLDNGLTVAHLPLSRAPVVTVQVWYRAGAKDEPQGKRGLARMFERLMFQGSPRVPPGKHAEYLDRLGGYVAAESTEDATWFTNVVPKDYLDFVLELEADRMGELVLRDAAVAQEREVAKQRLSQEVYDPVQAGLRRFLPLAYQKHPYGSPGGGNVADLESVTTDDVRGFYDQYFNPDNALVVVVGDVTRAEVEAAVKQRFGSLERGAEIKRQSAGRAEPAQTGMRKRQVGSLGVGLVIGGFHIPEARHPDIYALQVLSLILGSGDTSVLGQRLKRDRKLAVDVGGQALVWEEPGIFALMAAYEAEGKGDDLAAALLEEAQRMQKGPGEAHLRRARNQIQAGFVYGLEGVAEIGQQVGTSWILTGDPGQFLRDLEALSAVSAEDVARVAKAYLTEDNYTVIISPPPRGQGGTP
jgi:zinc protease